MYIQKKMKNEMKKTECSGRTSQERRGVGWSLGSGATDMECSGSRKDLEGLERIWNFLRSKK